MLIYKNLTHNFGISEGYIEIDSSSIDFPIRKNILGQKRIIDVPVECFSIELVSCSDFLSVNRDMLLKIKFVGGVGLEGMRIEKFHLTAYNNPYQILLNHNAILDCQDLDKDLAELKFNVKLFRDGEIIIKDYSVTINLVKAKPNCGVIFIPNESIKYRHENICVGCFKVENVCSYRFAELAAIDLTVQYPIQFLEDVISFGKVKEITESNPYYEESGLREINDTPESILKINRLSDQKLQLKRITAQNEIVIPIYFDLDRLENPETEIKTEKFILFVKNILNDYIYSPQEYFIQILRDSTSTRLFVTFNKTIIYSNSKGNYGHFNWIHHQTGRIERFVGSMQIAQINIGNEASNKGLSQDSAVIIKDIKIYPIYSDEEIMYDVNFLDTEEISDDVIVLKNGANSFVSYYCFLQHRNIIDIPMNITRITFNIEFDYVEDEQGVYDGSNVVWNHFHSVATIELEKDPGSEWLCVDFGTSATVAIYGDGTERNYHILSLNERNKEIIAERENERFRTPRFEEGEYFLSSNIMLQSNVPSIETDDINRSLIYLSPSEPRFHSVGYRLPYMKALVGYKNLPNGEHYANFEYKFNDCDTEIHTFGDIPLEVDKIFAATYKSLFKDYISKCIPTGKEINKIVLTIPNTYTPHHIEFIKDIVIKELPTLRTDYIWFVSESDAIAYYYLKNWNSFNREKKEYDEAFIEHILVYDMGAGTLDLTYFTIEHLDTGDKKVSMISKMGLNKAGDYLDYILARALVEEYPDKFPVEILAHTDDDTMQNLLGKLKFFIKNTLKPNLFSRDSIIFSDWNGQTILGVDFNDENLDLARIRSNSIVQTFVTECTDLLFDRFTQIGGLKMDESPIDTLIMTGRSIQFGDIKNRLIYKVRIWNDDNHCTALEISGDELKTIVSQGALYYATLYGKRTSSVILSNKNIYAKYGVLYVNRKNRWQYQPLIDANTKSTKRSVTITGQQNGMQIFTYDTDRFSADNTVDDITLDMRNTIEAYLVQCYSPDPAKDYEDAETRNDYISIMAAFNPESVCQDTRNVHLRLEINERNEMIFTAGDLKFDTAAPVKIDVELNNTFKHSMWPYA